jgi:hypothetical protein
VDYGERHNIGTLRFAKELRDKALRMSGRFHAEDPLSRNPGLTQWTRAIDHSIASLKNLPFELCFPVQFVKNTNFGIKTNALHHFFHRRFLHSHFLILEFFEFYQFTLDVLFLNDTRNTNFHRPLQSLLTINHFTKFNRRCIASIFLTRR